jgi:DNA-3-methyladenine glycosylase I
MSKAVLCPDKKKRCKWSTLAADFPLYQEYHDTEWGFAVTDDVKLFEKICLEGFQSGLSWRTILVKRENFRKAFKGFDFNKVARFKEKDIERLLADEGIVRHRGKIEATINNAKQMKPIIKEFGSFAAYIWSFEPQSKRDPKTAIPSQTPESVALSKDLKKRGWKFVGPTTIYAFMQGVSLVNDHDKDCFVYKKAMNSRKSLTHT